MPWILVAGFASSTVRRSSSLRCLLAPLALLLAALAVAAPAAAQTSVKLVSNTGQSSSGELHFVEDFLEEFTTGSSGEGYKLTGVSMVLDDPGSLVPTFTLQIRDATGRPGTFLGTLDDPDALTQGENKFTASGDGIDLEPDTTYYVFLDVTDPSLNPQMTLTVSNNEDAGSRSGWTIANTSLRREYDRATQWVSKPDSVRIAVYGYEKDSTAPVLQSASVDGDTLKLNYDDTLVTGSAPATTDLKVTVTDGTTSADQQPTKVEVSGTVVTLTLGTAVTPGQTVTVTYTAGTDPIENHAGLDAGNLSGQSVVNTTGRTEPTVDTVAVVSTPSYDADANDTPETYGVGEEIQVRLTFSEAVTVTGMPRLKIKMSPTADERYAEYGSGGGTTTLTFVYTVVEPDTSTGIAVIEDTLELHTGTIASAATQAAAVLDHDGLAHDAAHRVNWKQESTPPMLDRATVHGPTLKLAFDEDLDDASVPSGDAFTVSATPAGGSTRSISGTTDVRIQREEVVVTLEEEVTYGETVTVAYTDPGGGNNPLRDNAATPNEVKSFSGEPVINLTGEPGGLKLLVGTVDGNKVTLYFGETLHPSAGSLTAKQFSLAPSLGAINSNVERLENWIRLTTANTASKGQALTISISDTEGIEGLTGNTLNSVSGYSLTNITGTSAPAPVLAATDPAVVKGDTLTLTYDRTLHAGRAPAASNFTVAGTTKATGVDAVVISGTAVVLTLSPPVEPGDTGIELSYAKNAKPFTQNLQGDQSAAFTGQAVTNDTAEPAQPPPPVVPPPPVQSTAPSFGVAAVASLALDRGRAMAPVVLPRATGGDGTLTYSLTSSPAGLAGLDFDPATRRLSGTPGASGSWTFTYRAEDADADRTDSDAAVLTFEVTVTVTVTGEAKAAVKRTLSGVAVRTLSSALGHIGVRLANVVPSAGLTLAGRRMEFAIPGMGVEGAAGACAWGGFDRYGLDRYGFDRHGLGHPRRDGLGLGGGCAGWSRGIGTEELLRASAFSWLLGAAEGSGGADPAAPRWAVWGRGDFSDFAGRPEDMRYDGNARSGWLGVDARRGRWVAGFALSHGVSEADYSYGGGAAGGRLETTLTALYPYGRWTLAEGLEVRGVLGAGSGEARHMPGDAEAATSDLTMRMGSAGVRRELAEVFGIELAARADASLVRMEIGAGPEFIGGVSADSWRARVGLEATRRVALGEKSALTPFLEVAGRRDGGDGLEGSGLEVAGGVRYTAPRVEVEARGRLLAAHAEEGARERGVSVTARLGPGARGRGLSLSLRPHWGAGTGGAEALWRDELPGLSGDGEEAALDARIGYGVGLAERGLLTPFVEAGVSKSRRLRVGTRFDGWRADLGMELSGERREDGNGEAEHGVLLDLRLRF